LEVKAVCSESRTHGLTGAEFPQGDLATLRVGLHQYQIRELDAEIQAANWNVQLAELNSLKGARNV